MLSSKRARTGTDEEQNPTSRVKPSTDEPVAGAVASSPCSKCNDNIPDDMGTWFVLDCCPEKKLCTKCFAELVSGLVNLTKLVCPSCGGATKNWTSHYPSASRSRSGFIQRKDHKQRLEDPTPQGNLQAAYSEGYDHRSVGVCVVATSDPNEDEEAHMETYSDILNAFDTHEWSEEQIKMFEKIFKIFHSLFIAEDKSEKPIFDPVAYPTNNSIDRLAQEDRSVLHRLICCLAYGQTIDDITKEMESSEGEKSYNRVLKTTFAAKDLIASLRSNKNEEGLIKAMIGVHCAAQAAPDNLFAVLNDFNLAPSKNTVNRFYTAEANKKILEGFDYSRVSRWDYPSDDFDNEGFKVRGGTKDMVGFLQTTHHRQNFTRAERATKAGLYFDPENPDREVLSRKDSKDWDNEKQKPDFPGWNGIKKPQDVDYDNLSGTVYSHADYSMELEANDKFPSYKESEQMCLQFRFEYSTEKLPRFYEFGSRKVIEGPEGETELYTTLSASWNKEDQAESDAEGSANEILKVIDLTFEGDLNKEEIVRALIDYAIMMRKKILEQNDEETESPDREFLFSQSSSQGFGTGTTGISPALSRR